MNNKVSEFFDEWLEYKTKKKNNSEDTKKQNRASYEKYVKGTAIDTMPLTDIKPIQMRLRNYWKNSKEVMTLMAIWLILG